MAANRGKPEMASWQDVADRYRSTSGRCGPDLAQRAPYPDVLRLMGRVRRKRVLEVECGSGAFARLLAHRGAHVTAIDASPRAIELARRDAADAIEFQVAEASDPRSLPKGPFDLVVILLSLQSAAEPRRVLRNVARPLRPGGHLLLALYHPCLRIPGSAHGAWDVDAYRSPGAVDIAIEAGSDPKRPAYHWPLESLFGWLREARLRVVDLAEPVSDVVPKAGHPEAADRARVEIPLFLVLLAERMRARPKNRGTSR